MRKEDKDKNILRFTSVNFEIRKGAEDGKGRKRGDRPAGHKRRS